MPLSTTKTVKAYIEERFEVRLVQVDNGAYRIMYQTTTSEPEISEPMLDYKTASALFDMKCIELGGN